MRNLPENANKLDFYADAIRILRKVRVPFLVGGAYALREYTGVSRDTKDFDIFLRSEDVQTALAAFRKVGYRAETTFSHWLAKVHYGENFIDIIFRAGNGLCEVDDLWFRQRKSRRLLGQRVTLVPPEEMIWQKAYIMERERFDGADVAHLLRSCADGIDWNHLLWRFGQDWRVLVSHLLLYGFIYPDYRDLIPRAVMERLLEQVRGELASASTEERTSPLCQGTLISRKQYLPDIERWGYRDVRSSRSKITPEELSLWTNAIAPDRTGA